MTFDQLPEAIKKRYADPSQVLRVRVYQGPTLGEWYVLHFKNGTKVSWVRQNGHWEMNR
jgi:hypothetical protein